MSSWREGGGRNLQPPALSAAPPCDTDTKSNGLAEASTPLPPSSSPPSTAAAQSPDLKEPSLRPAQPVQRRAAPSALQYQHHTTTTYHDMLPAFVSLHTSDLGSKCLQLKLLNGPRGTLSQSFKLSFIKFKTIKSLKRYKKSLNYQFKRS